MRGTFARRCVRGGSLGLCPCLVPYRGTHNKQPVDVETKRMTTNHIYLLFCLFCPLAANNQLTNQRTEPNQTGPCSKCLFHQGSTTSTPLNAIDEDGDVVGDTCPVGYYCPMGSSFPSACPPGTFSNSTGNTNLNDCQQCTPGFTCPDASTAAPTEPCPSGFYCPSGAFFCFFNIGITFDGWFHYCGRSIYRSSDEWGFRCVVLACLLHSSHRLNRTADFYI